MKISTEIVVPVHDQSRPIRRAVESLLCDHETRALVIAHNIDPGILDIPNDERVRVERLNGFVGRPGACFNAGIAAAKCKWVGIMGSDDWYEPGALEAMRRHAIQDKADGVIAPLKHQTQSHNQIKPITLRRKKLRAERDRMFYRTAPLGIYDRDLLSDSTYRFSSEFPVGEDMRVTAALWTSGKEFSYYWSDPAYVVGSDANSRVTLAPRPLAESGAPYFALLKETQVQNFDRKTRHSFAVKMVRIHVLTAVVLRPSLEQWQPGDFEWLKKYLQALTAFDRTCYQGLSLRDQRIIWAIRDGDLADVLSANKAWKQGNFRERVFPRNLLAALTEKDSNLRWALCKRLREFI